MSSDTKTPRLPVYFYRTSGGIEPVRVWLKALPAADRRILGFDLERVQVGWPVGMPLCRSLSGGLWELRSNLPSGRIARMLFFIHGDRIGVVHGFIKKTQKTQKTPDDILDQARKRMKEMQE